MGIDLMKFSRDPLQCNFPSGKTHTMMGDENNDGLMLMAIKHIFNEVQSSNIEFVIR